MLIDVSGKGLRIGGELEKRVQKKLAKYGRFFDDEARMSVKISPEGDQKRVEITIRAKRVYLRAESVCDDVFDALDRSEQAISRQVRKHKTRIDKHHKDLMKLREFLANEAEEGKEPLEEEQGRLIKRKRFEIEVMTPEEACLQMDLLGHSFLLFRLPESHEVAVVYRRLDGNYGMIEDARGVDA